MFFYQVALKSMEYFFVLFLSVISRRDKAQREPLGARNFSELKALLTKDGQFPSLVWQDCA